MIKLFIFSCALSPFATSWLKKRYFRDSTSLFCLFAVEYALGIEFNVDRNRKGKVFRIKLRSDSGHLADLDPSELYR